jgi:hypothetical protein
MAASILNIIGGMRPFLARTHPPAVSGEKALESISVERYLADGDRCIHGRQLEEGLPKSGLQKRKQRKCTDKPDHRQADRAPFRANASKGDTKIYSTDVTLQ